MNAEEILQKIKENKNPWEVHCPCGEYLFTREPDMFYDCSVKICENCLEERKQAGIKRESEIKWKKVSLIEDLRVLFTDKESIKWMVKSIKDWKQSRQMLIEVAIKNFNERKQND